MCAWPGHFWGRAGKGAGIASRLDGCLRLVVKRWQEGGWAVAKEKSRGLAVLCQQGCAFTRTREYLVWVVMVRPRKVCEGGCGNGALEYIL